MKCSACQAVLDTTGFVITVVRENSTYTATLHLECFRNLVGRPHSRKLESLAFESDWVQTGLPLLRDMK